MLLIPKKPPHHWEIFSKDTSESWRTSTLFGHPQRLFGSLELIKGVTSMDGIFIRKAVISGDELWIAMDHYGQLWITMVTFPLTVCMKRIHILQCAMVKSSGDLRKSISWGLSNFHKGSNVVQALRDLGCTWSGNLQFQGVIHGFSTFNGHLDRGYTPVADTPFSVS